MQRISQKPKNMNRTTYTENRDRADTKLVVAHHQRYYLFIWSTVHSSDLTCIWWLPYIVDECVGAQSIAEACDGVLLLLLLPPPLPLLTDATEAALLRGIGIKSADKSAE